jgi:hypothetical protein
VKRILTTAAATLALLHAIWIAPAGGYVLNRTISDSGGCPELNRFDTSMPATKKIDRRWSTSASTSVRTTTGAWSSGNAQQEAEIEASILRAFDAWTGVSGSTLNPGSQTLVPLTRTATQSACDSFDARNTICFNQSDSVFTTAGILAFARVNAATRTGPQQPAVGNKSAVFVGEILDADVYFKPNDVSFTFATPGALTASHFDLESVLTHELGHFFGFSHSSVWRAMMWPFVPPRGQFQGDRPTAQQPDAQLTDDDRAGLRILYPDPADAVNVGSIRGRILPANPIALATLPEPSPGRPLEGIFGTQVVAVDADTGEVVAGTLGGWTCDPQNLPTRFDGTYVLERLPVGRSYRLYVEPLDGPTGAAQISNALDSLCRTGTNNSCTVPQPNTSFVSKVRP